MDRDKRDLTNQAWNEKNKTIKGTAESLNKSIGERMKQINELADKVDWTSGSKGNIINSVYVLFACHS